jgi:DNA sulfur modification protein DndD
MLVDVEAQADREAVNRVAGSMEHILAERDKEVLARLRKLKLPESTLKAVASVLETDRGARRAEATAAPYLELADGGRSALNALSRDILEQTRQRVQSLITDWSALRATHEEYERQIAAIPTAEELAVLLAERDEARRQLKLAEADLEAASGELTRVRAYLSKLDDQKKKRNLRIHETKGEFADAQRSLKHIGKVKNTLQQFRQELLNRHVGRLESLSFDSLQQLLRKERLVTAIQIDPKSFAVTLRGAGGAEIPADRLSAGERQLLATALLWGLRRAAGRAVPLVIDTPLGRLDSSHREHLVTRYFPHASHQVLLLSTDEEISGRYYDTLKPHIASEFTLETDDAAQSVRVRPGYFVASRGAAYAS